MNEEFKAKIISLRGDAGRKWLDSIPNIIKKYEEKWRVSVGEPYNLSYNYVAPATKSDGAGVVIKIGFPGDKEFLTEMEALKIFDGRGAIKILEEDLENFIVLLEKAEPGSSIKNLKKEDELTSVLIEVLKNLQKPYPLDDKFPTISDWGKAFDRVRERNDGGVGPFPIDLFEKAEKVFKEYKLDSNNSYLLHGDLHNDNILFSERGWIVIDPKGLIGEKEFEVAAFLRNPLDDYKEKEGVAEIVKRRILKLSEGLGYDKNKIKNWAFASAMLSAVWVLEDHGEISELYINGAKILDNLSI